MSIASKDGKYGVKNDVWPIYTCTRCPIASGVGLDPSAVVQSYRDDSGFIDINTAAAEADTEYNNQVAAVSGFRALIAAISFAF